MELALPAMHKRRSWDEDDVLAASGRPEYSVLEVRHGVALTHTGSRFTGTVAGFAEGDRVLLVDDMGRRESFRVFDGAFIHEGRRVALRAPTTDAPRPQRLTPSGSRDVGASPARVARGGRIWVEGIHDAELVEKIWGYDLREAGVVVEPLHGIDDLPSAVTVFDPVRSRRLGVLLDHLIAGSKEAHIAHAVRHPQVLVCGHPYVDVWQAIRPEVVGLADWPEVPPGRSWKDGVLGALAVSVPAGQFWSAILDRVTSYRDVETPLVNAVERLIDFVTASD